MLFVTIVPYLYNHVVAAAVKRHPGIHTLRLVLGANVGVSRVILELGSCRKSGNVSKLCRGHARAPIPSIEWGNILFIRAF